MRHALGLESARGAAVTGGPGETRSGRPGPHARAARALAAEIRRSGGSPYRSGAAGHLEEAASCLESGRAQEAVRALRDARDLLGESGLTAGWALRAAQLREVAARDAGGQASADLEAERLAGLADAVRRLSRSIRGTRSDVRVWRGPHVGAAVSRVLEGAAACFARGDDYQGACALDAAATALSSRIAELRAAPSGGQAPGNAGGPRGAGPPPRAALVAAVRVHWIRCSGLAGDAARGFRLRDAAGTGLRPGDTVETLVGEHAGQLRVITGRDLAPGLLASPAAIRLVARGPAGPEDGYAGVLRRLAADVRASRNADPSTLVPGGSGFLTASAVLRTAARCYDQGRDAEGAEALRTAARALAERAHQTAPDRPGPGAVAAEAGAAADEARRLAARADALYRNAAAGTRAPAARPPARSPAAGDHAVAHFRADGPLGAQAWYSVRGAAASRALQDKVRGLGWDITPGDEDLTGASTGPLALRGHALGHGWDVIYAQLPGDAKVRPDGTVAPGDLVERVTARNPETPGQVEVVWIGGRIPAHVPERIAAARARIAGTPRPAARQPPGAPPAEHPGNAQDPGR